MHVFIQLCYSIQIFCCLFFVFWNCCSYEPSMKKASPMKEALVQCQIHIHRLYPYFKMENIFCCTICVNLIYGAKVSDFSVDTNLASCTGYGFDQGADMFFLKRWWPCSNGIYYRNTHEGSFVNDFENVIIRPSKKMVRSQLDWGPRRVVENQGISGFNEFEHKTEPWGQISWFKRLWPYSATKVSNFVTMFQKVVIVHINLAKVVKIQVGVSVIEVIDMDELMVEMKMHKGRSCVERRGKGKEKLQVFSLHWRLTGDRTGNKFAMSMYPLLFQLCKAL